MPETSKQIMVPAKASAEVVLRTGRLVREFIVESVGADLGDAMTADGMLLAGRLGDAGHLNPHAHQHHPAGTSARAMIREFIVETVGEDLGDEATALAVQLYGHLASAGVLAGGVYEPVPLQPRNL